METEDTLKMVQELDATMSFLNTPVKPSPWKKQTEISGNSPTQTANEIKTSMKKVSEMASLAPTSESSENISCDTTTEDNNKPLADQPVTADIITILLNEVQQNTMNHMEDHIVQLERKYSIQLH